ncbi:V-set and transmembrane domain-containing protein 2-like protein isoform X1 [Brienomyrus brachyistius]|uniref:V-set and transmembrane domain-containing protein 2-like protein isoform X1 n=1 Tax=Brienomyrus brachyistius TaxID=42636 RepID=UPI0020B2627F|nr:V-set and transmembrane domain-containing protein 2-like protein isoform X1 [Brienomyrus brachyistius]
MGSFGVIIGILHYMGLYVQFSVSSRQGGHGGEIENRISGNAFFTEVPHDITAQSGEDVEMACSFRGAGSPSYSLEIQWWYIRNYKDWTDNQVWNTNQVVPQEQISKDATKISVVKVAGSNISHKLRLSNVKPADEGTYECRVIDFSDGSSSHHRVRAYLQVEPEHSAVLHHHQQPMVHSGIQKTLDTQPAHITHKGARQLKKHSEENPTGCSDGCVL